MAIMTCRLELLLADFSKSLAIVKHAEGSSFASLEISGCAPRHEPVIPDLVRQPFEDWCLGLTRRYLDVLKVEKSYVWQRELGE